MQKLYRSTKDKQLSGVLGGLSEIYNMEVSLVRIVTALLFFATGGMALVAYIIAAIVMPTDKQLEK